MRECILDLCGQFAEGTAVFLDIEQRVIAEAACTVVLAEQFSFTFTAHGERFAVRDKRKRPLDWAIFSSFVSIFAGD